MSAAIHTTEAQIQLEMLDECVALGWTLVRRPEMNQLRGPARMNEAIVEPLLIQAIQDLNDGIDEAAAHEIAAKVRAISSDREMLDALRDGIPYKPAPDTPTRDITILDSDHPSRNSYVVTEEFVIQTGGQREPRLDVVWLVNGLPLGANENKDTSEPISAAADDWRGYWHDAPQLVAQIAVVACCNGLAFMVGPSGKQDLDGYLEWTDGWPHQIADEDDEMLVGLAGAFAPHTLVDLATNFVLFETREGITTKKLARAHQFRAANKIVQRVIDGQLDRGIVWHATGSGKSLTMVFAARKLLRSGLGNPTVLLVIDRSELDEQINETLTSCEFDGVAQARSRRHLSELLGNQAGGVIVTTVHKFDESMGGLLSGHPVIAFVDEAHRTQFGNLAIWMRKALPDGALFGFTGTPIETDARSTRKWFSPKLPDDSYEPYLDRYGFDEAIADGATVPVVYERRQIDWSLTRSDIDARFDELTDGLDEEQRNRLRSEGAKPSVVAKAPARVEAQASDIARQLATRITPSGFVAQVVAVDREACALLADALAAHLQPDEYAVIMSRSKKDSDLREGQVDIRRWYPAAHWERVHGQAPQQAEDDSGEDEAAEGEDDGYTAASDRAAIKDFVARFKREGDPLALLIVNAMLLTGFDAPREQALMLDRPLRGHTLMQAISRTNRRFPGKDAGLILDYWGVFDELHAALEEFAGEDLAGIAQDSEHLVARFPEILDEAMGILAGAPAGASPRRRMLWVVRRLTDAPEDAERFEELVHKAQSTFETLSPDPRLADHLDRYRELIEIWAAWIRGTRRDQRTGDELRYKTRELVRESIGFDRLRADLPAATIDAEFLDALRRDEDLHPDEMATDIESAVVHEIKVRGEDDPLARALAERLARLREKQKRERQMTLEGLDEWEGLVREYVAEREGAEALGLDQAGGIVLAVLRRAGETLDEDVVVETARRIADGFRAVAGFDGWSERPDVVQGLRKAAVRELVANDETRRLALRPEVLDDLLAGLGTLDR